MSNSYCCCFENLCYSKENIETKDEHFNNLPKRQSNVYVQPKPTESNSVEPIYDIKNDISTLADEPWFHGALPKKIVNELLKNNGDFLVRESIQNDHIDHILSLFWDEHKHIKIIQDDTSFSLGGLLFPSVAELIGYYWYQKIPLSKNNCIISNPIVKEAWVSNHNEIILEKSIGKGFFGEVHKAVLKGSKKEVAVKTCKKDGHESNKMFIDEGKKLKQYQHPNIVKLIGICITKPMIIMEYLPNGSLDNFLKLDSNAPLLTDKLLTHMCLDIAKGMNYLELKSCIHRDLAARNCLVGNDYMIKISDFGMLKEEEVYVATATKPLPIKWTAPEALKETHVFTSLSDVWSYGVVCWEIFSHGAKPYSDIINNFISQELKNGYRLPQPLNTPEGMYHIMQSCWEYQPENRPHFSEIIKSVKLIYKRF